MPKHSQWCTTIIKSMLMLTRHPQNPILLPSSNEWERKAAFNGSVVATGNAFHMVYRALSQTTFYKGQSMQVSTVGYAQSNDGIHFSEHKQLIQPEYFWEEYGCEDPRITYFEGKYYIFYTALSNYPFNADGIKVALALSDDLQRVNEKHLITPFNAKAMALFPERINGKIAAVLAVNTDRPPAHIALALFDHIEELWSESYYWKNWYASLPDHSLPVQREANDQVEVGAVPVKTDAGWLLIHSYIKNYYSDNKIFGIEAMILDPDDPFHVLGRTTHPLLVPETDYEKYGEVPNIVFPTGAVVKEDTLFVYYGGADTNTCVATCKLSELLADIQPKPLTKTTYRGEKKALLTRFDENPIMIPKEKHPWEDKAVFNPAAVYSNGKFHIIYRAMSQGNNSVFGYASSTDGLHIDERLPDPIYVPREVFEKNPRGGNGGCEDPRMTHINGRYYVLYTAYDGEHPPRVAMSSISEEDFLNKKWHWAIPKLISPPDIDDKDACIFPEKINGKYAFLHRLQSAIWLDYADDLHFYEGKYLGGSIIMEGRKNSWDNGRIGIASVPIATDKGWILLYHGIDETENHNYKVGAALLDRNNPAIVIKRLAYPILAPEMHYEKEGQIANVVFPCGSIVQNGTLFVYYGGADSVVGVATIELSHLLSELS